MLRNIGRLRAGGSGFNPASLFAAGEQGVWYDPSDFSTMFQDAAGTTPVTATTQPVGKILDKSGRGNHATQSTTANRPTLQQDGSGYYYLSFNGTNSSLATASINFTGTAQMTLIAGLVEASHTGPQALVSMGTFNGAQPGSFEYDINVAANVDGVLLNGSTYAYAQYVQPALNTAAVITAGYDISQNTNIAAGATLRINGVSQTANATVNTGFGTGNFSNLALNFGARGNATNFFNGRMYPVIVRGTSTTLALVQSAEGWVNARTGAF